MSEILNSNYEYEGPRNRKKLRTFTSFTSYTVLYTQFMTTKIIRIFIIRAVLLVKTTTGLSFE